MGMTAQKKKHDKGPLIRSKMLLSKCVPVVTTPSNNYLVLVNIFFYFLQVYFVFGLNFTISLHQPWPYISAFFFKRIRFAKKNSIKTLLIFQMFFIYTKQKKRKTFLSGYSAKRKFRQQWWPTHSSHSIPSVWRPYSPTLLGFAHFVSLWNLPHAARQLRFGLRREQHWDAHPDRRHCGVQAPGDDQPGAALPKSFVNRQSYDGDNHCDGNPTSIKTKLTS